MSDAREERPVWEGHRKRLRQRMEREGWEALRPHEKVELVLNYAVPRQNMSDMARMLVNRFGTVGGVFSAGREQLLALEGMTPRLAEWIGLTGELMRAYFDLQAEVDIRLSCYREMAAFLKARLARAGSGLWAVYADFDFNLITCTRFGDAGGELDAAVSRQIMIEAINNGARYVYLVRVSEAAPRTPDEGALARVRAVIAALRAADLDLVDFVQAGGGELRSLRLRGELSVDDGDPARLALNETYDDR